MRYLNLTEGYNPFNVDERGDYYLRYNYFTFPGGEPHFTLIDIINDDVTISCKLTCFADLGKLICATTAVRNHCAFATKNRINVVIPYFPGARQDRIANDGEILTVKVYTNIVNSLKFDSVTILDPHSEVVTGLLDNVHVIDNYEFVNKVIENLKLDTPSSKKFFYLISPDSGANKKIKDLGKFLSYLECDFEIVKCDKTRDTKTGEITGFEVYKDDLNQKPCIIVDDICDGGGTFIGLAKELKDKNAKGLTLAVTHGIFSKGFAELNKYFDSIKIVLSYQLNYKNK
jgi:ribose-phosphate pyrophosphokinase